MGIHIIRMPDIGEGIAEVELVGWHVAVGDTVTEDQPLADVMTDKATVEIPSPVNGTVLALGGTVGTVMAVGGELIRLEVEGAGNQRGTKETAGAPETDAPETGSGAHASPGPAVPSSAPVASDMVATSGAKGGSPAPQVQAGEQVRQASAPASGRADANAARATPGTAPATAAGGAQAFTPREPGARPQASPAVRKRAWDLGIELRFVRGTGEADRILHEDLDAFLQGKAHAVHDAGTRNGYRPRHDEEQIPVIGLRRKIAQKMQEAKRRIPHFSYVEEIDVTELESLRADLNTKWGQARGRLTILPLLARAMVIALRDFPQINARYDDEAGVVTRYGAVHIGIATQSDAGLMVPVLEHAEARDVWEISAEIARLAQAVRSGRAGRNELSGSTITITSLGPLGGIVTTPVINHPEVGIVGVNRIVERPMFRHGAVVPRKLMNLSSSFDHRVVDGMDAAQFIQAVRALLEQPAMLFVDVNP